MAPPRRSRIAQPASPELGARVFDLRRARGWSQTNLGDRMIAAGHPTWHYGTVGLLEVGERHLRLYEGYSMARIFAISLRDLAWGTASVDQMLASQQARLEEERRTCLLRLQQLDYLLGVNPLLM